MVNKAQFKRRTFHVPSLILQSGSCKIKSVKSDISNLRGSLPKSGPLDFATKSTFPLFFVGEEALVGVY